MATDLSIRNNPGKIIALREQAQTVIAELDALEAMTPTQRADAVRREATIVQYLEHMARHRGKPI
jgi:hypothetical protein